MVRSDHDPAGSVIRAFVWREWKAMFLGLIKHHVMKTGQDSGGRAPRILFLVI